MMDPVLSHVSVPAFCDRYTPCWNVPVKGVVGSGSDGLGAGLGALVPGLGLGPLVLGLGAVPVMPGEGAGPGVPDLVDLLM